MSAEETKTLEAHLNRIGVARNAILADLKRRAIAKDPHVRALNPSDAHRWHKPQDNYYSGSGETDCPVCKTGRLRYSRAGYNGHVHAGCSTSGCVAWVE